MDGSFACPECGSDVQVRGLAPGRQVRCEFCHRLLEVPYLPRAAGAPWKRRRYTRPKWVAWAWAGLCLLLVVILGAGAMKFLRRQYDSIQDRSINRLLESSRGHEAEGRLGEALIDLDAAIQVAEKAGPAWMKRLERDQARRADLARRDARGVLGALRRNEATPFGLGAWLTLIERAKRDRDLAALGTEIDECFQVSVTAQITRELAQARQNRSAGNLVASMNACDHAGSLLAHLAKDTQPAFRQETEALVADLLKTAGITVVVPQGRFVYGSNSYVSEMLPILDQALEAKGYLPRRESSPWRELWRHSAYQMRLAIQEIQEGTYPSTQNRLTLILVEVALTSGEKQIWQRTARARSTAPLPHLPANLARQIAVSSERSDEFEQLLYKNARDQVVPKFRAALVDVPSCLGRTGPK
jgi:hypothetical protein